MPRYVCCLHDMFFEFSSIVEAPVTGLMTDAEFKEFSRRMYGDLYADGTSDIQLIRRMERAWSHGHSSLHHEGCETLEDFLKSEVVGFKNMQEFVKESWDLDVQELVDRTPGVVMPGDTGQQEMPSG